MDIDFYRIQKNIPYFSARLYRSNANEYYRTHLQVYVTSKYFKGFWIIIWGNAKSTS